MKLNKNNYVIGITGGVGAGKSIILDELANTYGARVYQADRISRSLTLRGESAFEPVVALFGKDILMKDGNPDRSRIAQIVFNDLDKLEKLNNIIHPEVRKFLKSKAKRRDGLIILEAALPIEAGFMDICDEIWYVYATKENRIKRVADSRGYSREKTEDIMKSQLSEKEFRDIATAVIDNNGTLLETEMQIENLISKAIDYLKIDRR